MRQRGNVSRIEREKRGPFSDSLSFRATPSCNTFTVAFRDSSSFSSVRSNNHLERDLHTPISPRTWNRMADEHTRPWITRPALISASRTRTTYDERSNVVLCAQILAYLERFVACCRLRRARRKRLEMLSNSPSRCPTIEKNAC